MARWVIPNSRYRDEEATIGIWVEEEVEVGMGVVIEEEAVNPK